MFRGTGVPKKGREDGALEVTMAVITVFYSFFFVSETSKVSENNQAYFIVLFFVSWELTRSEDESLGIRFRVTVGKGSPNTHLP